MDTGLLQSGHTGHLPGREHAVCVLGARVHEIQEGTGHQAVCTGGRGTEQSDTAGDRHAGDKAEQLREAEKMAVGKDSGETLQNQHPGAGTGTGAADGLRLLQPDHEHHHLLHRCQGGGGRTDDPGHDGVADLHHRAAQRPGHVVHRVRTAAAGCEDKPRNAQ